MPGHLILVRPHASRLDGPLVAWHMRKLGLRKYTFAIDPGYALSPFWRPALLVFGKLVGGHRMVALDSQSPHALRALLRILQAGGGVVLFPQGVGIRDADRRDQTGSDWLILRSECRVDELFLNHQDGQLPSVNRQSATRAL
jgi:1-acyl-sn-glycerol-3-phosphate acyltransferase